MLGTLDFTGSEHQAPFNFPKSTALALVSWNCDNMLEYYQIFCKIILTKKCVRKHIVLEKCYPKGVIH